MIIERNFGDQCWIRYDNAQTSYNGGFTNDGLSSGNRYTSSKSGGGDKVMSTLKVGTIQDPTNSNTVMTIDSGGSVLQPEKPHFQRNARSDSFRGDNLYYLE